MPQNFAKMGALFSAPKQKTLLFPIRSPGLRPSTFPVASSWNFRPIVLSLVEGHRTSSTFQLCIITRGWFPANDQTEAKRISFRSIFRNSHLQTKGQLSSLMFSVMLMDSCSIRTPLETSWESILFATSGDRRFDKETRNSLSFPARFSLFKYSSQRSLFSWESRSRQVFAWCPRVRQTGQSWRCFFLAMGNDTWPQAYAFRP